MFMTEFGVEDMGNWKGKIVLIADAESGVGINTGIMLAEQGVKLILCTRKGVKLNTCLKEKLKKTIFCVETPDFSDTNDLNHLISKVEEDPRFGKIDAMFFNRIPEVVRQNLAEMPLKLMDRLIEQDIMQAFLAAKIIGEFIGRTGGSMVFLGSIHDEKPTGIASLYSMYMGALKNMVREAALYFGYMNVSCNLIELGALEGDDVTFANDISKFYRAYKYKIPNGQVGTVNEAAELACFLMSGRCGHINGAEIRMDGGLILHYIDAVANAKACGRLEAQGR